MISATDRSVFVFSQWLLLQLLSKLPYAIAKYTGIDFQGK